MGSWQCCGYRKSWDHIQQMHPEGPKTINQNNSTPDVPGWCGGAGQQRFSERLLERHCDVIIIIIIIIWTLRRRKGLHRLCLHVFSVRTDVQLIPEFLLKQIARCEIQKSSINTDTAPSRKKYTNYRRWLQGSFDRCARKNLKLYTVWQGKQNCCLLSSNWKQQLYSKLRRLF